MSVADDIREKFQWRKVQAPKPWYPKEPGEELIGYYGGRTVRTGAYGQYEVVLVHVPLVGSWMVTGTRLIQLLDAAIINPGHPVRIVWKGLVETAKEHKMKDFDVLVAAGEAIPVDAMPNVPWKQDEAQAAQ